MGTCILQLYVTRIRGRWLERFENQTHSNVQPESKRQPMLHHPPIWNTSSRRPMTDASMTGVSRCGGDSGAGSSYTVGLIFGLRRKKFVGSYLFFRATSRS